MTTPPRRRPVDLSHLLQPVAPPHLNPDDVETRVDAALLAWVNGIIDESALYDRLSRLGIWHVTDTRWEMAQALAGRLHQVLVQLREAEREHAEEGAMACGPGPLSPRATCGDGGQCSRHWAWIRRFQDVLLTFREVVMVTVPRLATASVEATMRKGGLE